MEKTILNNLNTPIICLNEVHTISFFNKEANKLFGEHILKNKSLEKLFESDYSRLKKYLDSALENSNTYIFNLLNNFYKVCLKKIDTSNYILEFNNIEDEFFFEIFNNAKTGIVICHPITHELLYANQDFFKTTEYNKEEIKGHNLSILKVDGSDKKQRDKLKEKLSQNEQVTVVLKNKSKNGRIYYNKVAINPIRNKKTQRLQFFLGTQTDITSETIENKYFKALLNNSKSIILVNNNDKLKEVNKIFFEYFEFKNLDDFTSKHNCICELFIKKENTDYLTENMNGITWIEYINTHKNEVHKVCMIDKNNKEKIFQIDSSGKIFEDSNEEIIMLTDITNIIKSKEMLLSQTKNAMMGEMIAMIAHQWRQPLATLNTIYAKINILNQMDMLNSEEFSSAYNKSIEIVEHLSQTIEDFRNFFHKDEKLESVDLAKLIKKSYNILEPNFRNNEIILKVKYLNETENLEININSSKMVQVLLNLIKNAYDELINKKSKNKITTIICDRSEDNLLISVIDNAGGIPENVIDNIFDPYFSTKSKNGTGLGLYMSKLIIEEHFKGSLTVKNNFSGANFTIKLPLDIGVKK